MSDIDLFQVGAAAVGIVGGSYLGLLLSRRREAPGAKRGRDTAQERALPQAALTALAGFAGCALIEDAIRLLGRPEKGGYFLLKYMYAIALFVAVYASLRRRARALEAGAAEA